jgi:hypothetical protein
VLIVLIPIVWLAILSFGVAMCRLAGRSDDSQAAALAEWLATNYSAALELESDPGSVEQRLRGSFRATG